MWESLGRHRAACRSDSPPRTGEQQNTGDDGAGPADLIGLRARCQIPPTVAGPTVLLTLFEKSWRCAVTAVPASGSTPRGQPGPGLTRWAFGMAMLYAAATSSPSRTVATSLLFSVEDGDATRDRLGVGRRAGPQQQVRGSEA